MVYNTTEAYIEESKIVFKDRNFFPKTRTKVLVTFIDDNNDYELFELDNSEVSDELRDLSNKALQKDKKLLTNI